MPVRYLLDEHVTSEFRRQLLRRMPDLTVWRIGERGAPSIGTPDPDILAWCEAEGFLLVTSNRASMPVHLAEHLTAGRHVPGMLAIRRRATFNLVLNDLHLIAEVALAMECQDRIVYLPV